MNPIIETVNLTHIYSEGTPFERMAIENVNFKAYKGEHIAMLEARKQLCWYLKGVPHANYYKEQIVRLERLEQLYEIAKGIKRDLV